MSEELKEVADKLVVTMEYTLTVEGEVLDSSEDEGPLEYLQGFQNIIPGLEKEMLGMKIGESKSVKVAPADGYGEYDDDAIMEVPRDEIPDDVPQEVGLELELSDDEGYMMLATIVEVNEDVIKLDTNHPLAGKELHFEVKVIGLRAANDEELSHGHVHSGHGHHH